MRINLLNTLLAAFMAVGFLGLCDRAQCLDINDTIQGTIEQIKSNYIQIIKISDKQELKIAIDANTVYNNVQKMSDLKRGDRVQIDYAKGQNRNTATSITRLDVEG